MWSPREPQGQTDREIGGAVPDTDELMDCTRISGWKSRPEQSSRKGKAKGKEGGTRRPTVWRKAPSWKQWRNAYLEGAREVLEVPVTTAEPPFPPVTSPVLGIKDFDYYISSSPILDCSPSLDHKSQLNTQKTTSSIVHALNLDKEMRVAQRLLPSSGSSCLPHLRQLLCSAMRTAMETRRFVWLHVTKKASDPVAP